MEALSDAEDAVKDAIFNAEDMVLEAVSSAETMVMEVVSTAEDKILDATGSKTLWPQAACLLALFSSILFVWRLWSFTIRPYFHPREPKRFPYWIPYLGHAIPFHDDSYALITNGRSYFDETDEPIAFTVVGKTFYILTAPDHVAAAYENLAALSFDAYLNDLLLSFGVGRSALGKLWDEPCKGDARYTNAINPQHKSLVHLMRDLYRDQFLPGPNLADFSSKLLGKLDECLDWNKTPGRYVEKNEAVPLMDFCANVMIDATTQALFGDVIYKIEPRLTRLAIDFFDQAWKIIMFAYPKFAARKLYSSRQAIHGALLKYVQSPPKSRANESWLLTKVLEEQTAAGISDNEKASILFLLFWAANLNTYRASFWMLSYILFDKKLLSTLRAETGLTFQKKTIDYQAIHGNCPRLTSVFNEVLRLTFGSVSVRKIVAPVVIGNKDLCCGNNIMIPIRQLHYDEDAFGSDADEFDPERFLNNKLDHSPSYKPFAGGVTHCPGRFLAKQEVLVFVALVLQRFDIELVGNSSVGSEDIRRPEIDHVRPNMGIMAPVKGTEVYIKLKEST